MTTRAQQVVGYYKSGTQLFAAPIDQSAVESAKAYIKAEGYTADKVKLVQTDRQVLVVVR